MKKMLCLLMVCVAVCVARAEKEISVMQFNVWQEGTVVPGGFEAIADEIARFAPDFVTLSEVRNYNDTRFCDRITEALAHRGLDYHSFYSYDTGLLSRHPIIDSATVFPHCDDHGTIYRLNARIGDDEYAVYTAHLDYLNDTYYEVRGYDGCSWKPLEAPLTDVPEILRRNALSQRDEAVDSFLTDASRQMARGAKVILGGDFNEPSLLDWTEATADSADHHGVVIDWPATTRLSEAGFKDAYREIYPDAVTHPGYTYPADNPLCEINKLTWAPLADERERIDYVFHHSSAGLAPVKCVIVGPQGCIVRGKRAAGAYADTILSPSGVWPSDHKAVLVTFSVR